MFSPSIKKTSAHTEAQYEEQKVYFKHTIYIYRYLRWRYRHNLTKNPISLLSL